MASPMPKLVYENLQLPTTWREIRVNCDFIEAIRIAHPLEGGPSRVTLTLGGVDIPVQIGPETARDIVDAIAATKAGRNA